MGEQDTSGWCAIHGPGHIGQPCPDQAEKVEDPESEYGDLQSMFSIEHLDEHYDEVEKQMEEILYTIKQYKRAMEQYRTDPDMDVYVDEDSEALRKAFENFTINNKSINIRELTGEYDHEAAYNDMVYEINDYADTFMIGKRKPRLQSI